MKAGAFTPAIRSRLVSHEPSPTRSMKAGAFTPAIPLNSYSPAVLAPPRSMKAGAFTPAILEGPVLPCVVAFGRSMKAGAFTPAILSMFMPFLWGGAQSLNEGGGLHPRDPSGPTTASNLIPTLNEGGGLHPRDPSFTSRSWRLMNFAQ